jgi:subtilisin-like proprotein convertase family protein
MALADRKSLLKPKVTPPTGVSSGNFNFGTTSTQINTAFLSQAPVPSTPYETPSAGGGTFTPVSGSFSFTCAQSNIVIRDNTSASVYPVTFAVSGVPDRPLSSVALTLTNYSHTWVGDVGMVLVSPVSDGITGSFAVVSGRIGGSNDAVSASVTVTDNTTSSIWDGYSSGYFKNNSNYSYTLFAAPCPYPLTGSVSADFSNFAGLPQVATNGSWSLYIQDFAGGDTGFLQSAAITLNYY